MENKSQTASFERQRVGGGVISLTSPVPIYGYGIFQWSEEGLGVDFQLLTIGSYSPHAKIIGAWCMWVC